MALKKTIKKILYSTMLIYTITFLSISCKKDLQPNSDVIKSEERPATAAPASSTNPYSLFNINKARATLATQNIVTSNLAIKKIYSYIKFDANTVTGDILKQFEADTSIKILDFPFANGEIYKDDFEIDETKAAQLADGYLYAVTKKNSHTDSLLKNTSSLNSQLLDELYLPDETDTTLQFQALREIGYTETNIARIRLCLLQRPSGFVRYRDTETGNLVGTPKIQVWAFIFGIPIHTYTNNNGYYRFPWRFNFGTIIGTHAKNRRVNIKPINTQGVWAATLPFQFVVGSIHIKGWVRTCAMRDDVNFDFVAHKQNRYWAQLLHAVHLHDTYTAQDGINAAPNALTMYAHWANIYGAASAPMLGHVSSTPVIIEIIINNIFGGNISIATNYPNVFNLMNGLLPDITIKTGSFERRNYSASLMQTTFHELGHGTHYRRAGNLYWLGMISATLSPSGNCGGYGCGTSGDDGNVAVGESWAEFIGTNYALRNHPNGIKVSQWAAGQFLFVNGIQQQEFAGGRIPFNIALEREVWFFNEWIPTGIYNDLIDVTNSSPPEDFWDATGGLTILQLYQALGPKIDEVCIYRREILERYPQLPINDVNEIFIQHGYTCP